MTPRERVLAVMRGEEPDRIPLTIYENKLPDPDRGKSYPECFDVKAGRPTAEHAAFVADIKAELSAFGVPFTPAER